MKVLVVGSGGREHALAWKLAQSSRVTKMWCAPGNAGIGAERLSATGEPIECVPIGAEELSRLLKLAQEKSVDLTVVGPDNPLAMGIVDLFQEHQAPIWGPNRQAAQFEASKGFSQRFMEQHGIPTARAKAFSDAAEAKRFAAELEGRCAVKADGLALGKGVITCGDTAQAEEAIDRFLLRQELGTASERIVIQEFLEGREISIHALCDGKTARLFPTSRDYKPVHEGDLGPNTGGMGAYSPASLLSPSDREQIEKAIMGRWQHGCEEEGIEYRGVLYPGLMLTSDGPKVLEFNARFGDPETQVYLPRLENDLIELIEASLHGTLSSLAISWRPVSCVCVVMASGGYPGTYEKGKPISGLEEAAKLPQTKVFHAGTAGDGKESGESDRVVTSGGRVLGVTAWGEDIEAARGRAYEAVDRIRFEAAHFRRDIASDAF